MQAKNVSYTGQKLRFVMPNHTPSGIPSNATSGRYVVTPGSLVHGNFHDPNGWSYTVISAVRPRGVIQHTEGIGSGPKTLIQDEGTFGGNSAEPLPPAWDRALVYNRALENLNSKVRGNLDLSIDLAEAGTTGRMIKGIGDVISFARHPSRWTTKDLANGWLQWQYGWKPLFSSVYDVCDEQSRIVRKALTKVKGKCTIPIRVDETVVKGLNSTDTLCKRTGGGRQACTISVHLEPRGWDLDQWSSLNPVSLAWELIPYSFVIDWFYDIGSWMRNLESGLLYSPNFVTGYVSELFAVEVKENFRNYSNGYSFGPDSENNWRKVIDVKASLRRVDFVRTKLVSYPFPRKPTFKVDLGSQRLFSAAALLRQLLR